MKNALLLLSLLALTSACEIGGDGLEATGNAVMSNTWISSGIVAAPSTGLVLIDTGAQDDGDSFTGCIDISTSITGSFDFERRNAANDASLDIQRFTVSAAAPFHACYADGPVTLADDERLRVVNVLASLATVSVSMFHQ